MDTELDILGQQAIFNSYIPITYAYPVEDESSHASTVTTLENGLRRLSKTFPWVAGQVVRQGAGENNSSMFKIIPLEDHAPLVVKDLRNDPDIPTFTSLKEKRFPFAAMVMHESILSPRRTIPGIDPNEPVTRPTVLVQVTFIKGGLLLTIVGHHAAMDGTGLGQIMSLLSKACHNQPFTQEELASCNMARSNIIPFLDTVEEATAARFIVNQPDVISGAHDTAKTFPPKCTWSYINFDARSLAALKADTTKTAPATGGFISTDDALSALVWKSIMRARHPRLNPTDRTTLARAVDVRQLFRLPATYPGVMQINTYNTYSVHDLAYTTPIGEIASKLRAELSDNHRLVNSVRTLATLLHRAPDKQGILVVANLDIASLDLGMSSWVKLNCYDLDFDLGLGKPVAVRRPNWTPGIEGLLFLMPKTLDGDIAVGVCMRDEDLERLKSDLELRQYGQFIG